MELEARVRQRDQKGEIGMSEAPPTDIGEGEIGESERDPGPRHVALSLKSLNISYWWTKC
jgi:hypothetical protein